jgi:ABC-type bacteriocin/lantibiotic exporter with double-glycine peptidase domain
MNRHADTLLTLFPVIRLYDAARLTLGSYSQAVRAWESQTSRMERTKARLMSLSGLLSSIPLLLLFLIGGTMAVGGTLTVGTLYIFLNLSGNVSGALMNMPGFITAFRQFAANLKRLEGKLCL